MTTFTIQINEPSAHYAWKHERACKNEKEALAWAAEYAGAHQCPVAVFRGSERSVCQGTAMLVTTVTP